MENKKKNVIIKVEKNSIAEELGIQPGDMLLSVNNKEIEDIFDYRYLLDDEYIEICIETSSGEEYIAEIEKDFDEDIGIVFESGLMDNARRCGNKCIFCFIDQLPPGMRETLYFKDDDSRLSFLQGNYVTLTNMSGKDIDRIVYYHLSPINISVHTTDLELRKNMLGNKNAAKVLEIMKVFADAGIEMNLQVVLCKGINDGEILDKTISDCAKFIPLAKSMSVVPVGLTKYRDNLHKLERFDKEDAAQVIDQITYWQGKIKKETGTAFVFAADEFYLKANREIPSFYSYEDFPQYENGVGMLTYFKHEFNEFIKTIEVSDKVNKRVSLATGAAAYDFICGLMRELRAKFPNLMINVFCVKNEFFGEQITVVGLLTGQDIINQLKHEDLGEYLLLPDSLLRNGTETLLDDYEICDMEKALDTKIKITKNTGKSLILNILNMEDKL